MSSIITEKDQKELYRENHISDSFSNIEERIMDQWKKGDIFHKSMDKKRAEKKDYVFYDGPPFANGLPHYGHLLTGYIKAVSYTHLTLPTTSRV